MKVKSFSKESGDVHTFVYGHVKVGILIKKMIDTIILFFFQL